MLGHHQKSPIFYIDGHFVCQEKASIPVCDLSILRGCAIFDYLRTYQGRPFHLDEHLERLAFSASQVGLSLPHPISAIKEIVLETIARNHFAETSLKIVVTGGESPDQFTPSSSSKLLVLATPLTPYPAHLYTEGIKVITTPLQRTFPQAKTTHYLPAIFALQQEKAKGAKEALYLNAQGELLEGTTSNLFFIKQGELYTCDSSEILFGITREVVLKLAEPFFTIHKRALQYKELGSIDEAFLTASNKEILPICKIDEIPIGSGTVGPYTKQMIELFRDYTNQAIWPFLPLARHILSDSVLTS